MEGDASHDNTNPLQIQKWVGGKQFLASHHRSNLSETKHIEFV